MIFGTIAAYKVSTPTTSHWAGSVNTIWGHTIYIGLSAIVLNLVVAVVLTLIFKAVRVPEGTDETSPEQYKADRRGSGRRPGGATASAWRERPGLSERTGQRPVSRRARLIASRIPAWPGSARLSAGLCERSRIGCGCGVSRVADWFCVPERPSRGSRDAFCPGGHTAGRRGTVIIVTYRDG